ncbi:hypothetical protein DJ83_00105 [Halorubrum ezzemoulense]|uniref:Uncharacterized protein n=1 Tax=Halorubrum ezzemoulense TaxID=337243 RepID=A0A256J785_HALEZ|nr:hypothetical protein [Halorubrum ezzemoulense]OYR64660.1 hypothetical protein DJ83_00105 [Halorubrum ezzemoulense]
MDVRRALLGRPDGRFRIAGTVGLVFVFAFVLYAAYWRSNAAYGASTEVTTQLGAIRAVAPEISDIGHSRATAVLYLPAAAIAILVQYHGGAAIYTLAAGPAIPVASALARAAFSPLPDVLGMEVLGVTLPTQLRLGLAVGAFAVVVGSALRRLSPPSERSASERFFGSSGERHRAVVVIAVAAVLSVPSTFWLYASYPTYQPFGYAVFGAPIAALVYWYRGGIALAWLGDAAAVLGHATAIAFIADSPDYVLDPAFFVPALAVATALGSLGAGVAVGFRGLYVVVSRRDAVGSGSHWG